jgi:NADH-quinone oxidoreductase subunit J
MLPRAASRFCVAGVVTAAAAGGVLSAQVFAIGGWTTNSVFGVLAAVTVISGVGTVTMRSPVYCALWFAMTLLGTAGLFLFQGAQFLALATVAVYAGAIVVTFLFVLMLAQPRGHAVYDRVSWQPLAAAAVGAVMVGVLTTTIAGAFWTPAGELAELPAPTQELLNGEMNILAEDHTESLGARLFSQHLIAVEVVGVLLMVALIGAAAFVSHQQETRRLWSAIESASRAEDGHQGAGT